MRATVTVAVLSAILFMGDAAVSAAGAVTVWRGASGASGVTRTESAGVRVYRGAKPVEDELAGGEPLRSGAETQIVIVECRRPPKRYLRTQGFYSGHPGHSRRYTQGFWSGPVDLPKSSARVIRVKRM